MLNSTPKPKSARIKADKRRKLEEIGGVNSDNDNQLLKNGEEASTRYFYKDNQEIPISPFAASGDKGDVIKEVLKYSKNKYYKVLRFKKSYTDLYKEEKVIERAI